MSHPNTHRELAFLRYLDALDHGDAQGIVNYLKQAETDPILEDMMRTYHQEIEEKQGDSHPTTSKPTVITPIKRKHEERRYWVKRFGGGLVAAVLILSIGVVGLMIGLNQQSKDLLVADAAFIPEMTSNACYGLLTANTNIVRIETEHAPRMGGEYGIGLNEPLAIMPTDEGRFKLALPTTNPYFVHADDFTLHGTCDALAPDDPIMLYPRYYAGGSCSVTLADDAFSTMVHISGVYRPGDLTSISMAMDHRAYIGSLGDRMSLNYFGTFAEDTVQFTGDCRVQPLLFLPTVRQVSQMSTESQQSCTASLTSDDRTVRLLPYGNVHQRMTVQVNQPLTLTTNMGNEPYYDARLGTMRVHVDKRSIQLNRACNTFGGSITIEPQAGGTCEVAMDRVQLPTRSLATDQAMFYDSSLGDEVLTLEALQDGYYPVVDANFEARIPQAAVRMQGACAQYPVLYVPPSNPQYDDVHSSQAAAEAQVDLQGMRASYQSYEGGVMFYIKPIDQYWIGIDSTSTQSNEWLVIGGNDALNQQYYRHTIHPEGSRYAIPGILATVWQWQQGEVNQDSVQNLLGNPLIAQTFRAIDYAFSTNTDGERLHTLTIPNGLSYTFYEASMTWQVTSED